MIRDKVRIRFSKGGDLRLTSHHDLLRCFERMLRRADLPFHTTAGFNPKPRLVFAMPLPLGVIGCDEIADLELRELVPPDEVHSRLGSQAPAGLAIHSVSRIDLKTKATVRRVTYRINVSVPEPEFISQRIKELLASPVVLVQRERPRPRTVDLRPYIDSVRLTASGLECDLLATPNGSARPDEILALLGLSDPCESGAVFERTHIELD